MPVTPAPSDKRLRQVVGRPVLHQSQPREPPGEPRKVFKGYGPTPRCFGLSMELLFSLQSPRIKAAHECPDALPERARAFDAVRTLWNWISSTALACSQSPAFWNRQDLKVY